MRNCILHVSLASSRIVDCVVHTDWPLCFGNGCIEWVSLTHLCHRAADLMIWFAQLSHPRCLQIAFIELPGILKLSSDQSERINTFHDLQQLMLKEIGACSLDLLSQRQSFVIARVLTHVCEVLHRTCLGYWGRECVRFHKNKNICPAFFSQKMGQVARGKPRTTPWGFCQLIYSTISSTCFRFFAIVLPNLQSQIKQKFKINVGDFVLICTDALVSTSNKNAGG